MLLTLKEAEIRSAIVSYISGILGTKPEALDADAITLTAGRGTNGFTAEVDVQLVTGLVSASTPVTAEVPKAETTKPASKAAVIQEAPEVAEEVQEEEPPFKDAALELAESIPEEETPTADPEPEPEQEEVVVPRRRNPLFAKSKKDAE